MKLLAGLAIALSLFRLSIIALATFMNLGTAIERANGTTDGLIVLMLGCILWRLTQILEIEGG